MLEPPRQTVYCTVHSEGTVTADHDTVIVSPDADVESPVGSSGVGQETPTVVLSDAWLLPVAVTV